MRTARGITLIELLLTMGIVMLLAGIIFAVMSPARERSREAVCSSNLHQIGLAYQLYMSDCDGVEPINGAALKYYEVGLPPLDRTEYFFRKYVKDLRVLHCPSYHGSTPLDKIMNTYTSRNWESDQWAEIEAKRGLNLSLEWCLWHNPVADPLNGYLQAPRWETKRVNVLRLGGQVQFITRPGRDTESWTW